MTETLTTVRLPLIHNIFTKKKPWGNAESKRYRKTHEKPDKKYSILPTVLSLLGNVKDKVVLDLGCGDGFFSQPLAAQGPQKVIGIDNSKHQLNLANKEEVPDNLVYKESDIFVDQLPENDVTLGAFVGNYAENTGALRSFFKSVYNSLKSGGTFALVMDAPSGDNLKRFGATKHVESLEDGAAMEIRLYDKNGNETNIIDAFYYKPKTIHTLLNEVGFNFVKTHKPIIAPEGFEKYGEDFWNGYIDNPELLYVTAVK